MKKLLYTLAAVLVSTLAMAQTTTENYVKSTTYQTPVQNQAEIDALINDDKIESVTYFDGLGRPKQSIAKQAGGNKQDIITPIVYDDYGRQIKEYLPFADKDQVLGNQSLNYINPTTTLIPNLVDYYDTKFQDEWIPGDVINPYSEKVLEASPLARILEQGAPGKDWIVDTASNTDHTIKFEYETNIANEVKIFTVSHPSNNTEFTQLDFGGHYNPSELSKTVTKDENWTSGNDHTTEEFKDKLGRVILKRTYNGADGALDTQYVYDNYGNLTYVLSPEGSENILNASSIIIPTVLEQFCYQYQYDSRNRLIKKKIPGKDWEYIVYDKLNRPVLTQDANLRTAHRWLFTKYDAFGRVIYTGKYNNPPNISDARSVLQSTVDAQATFNESKQSTPITVDNTSIYYTNSIFPNTNIELYTINYYDDYNWDTINSFEASYLLNPSSTLTVDDGTIEKTTANGWSNAGFTTIGKIEDDGYVQFEANQTDKRLMVGLSRTNSAPNNSYSTIDYAIYLAGITSRVGIYEEGVGKSIPATYFEVGDVFKVERLGNQIVYKKNNVVFYASLTPSTGTLLGDSSFYNYGASIDNLFIGYSAQGQAFATNVKGLATGSKVRILETDDWTTTATYYDDKARPIYVNSKNEHIDTQDTMVSQLDFVGKVIRTKSTHKKSNSFPLPLILPKVINDEFSYDHAGRILRQTQIVNSEKEELIVKNNYDELGQLQQKQVGGLVLKAKEYTNVTDGITLTGNIIKKNGDAGSSWNQGLSTASNIMADGYVSFKTTQTFKNYMVGLSYTDANASYSTIGYAIYLRNLGGIEIRENGADKGSYSFHSPGDVFAVERRGTTIYYLKNNEVFHTSDTPTTTAPMIGDISIVTPNAEITDFVIVDLEKGLQDVDYTYNIRGWLKTINDVDNLGTDLFGFKINYNTPIEGNASVPALYNGNISQTIWKTANQNQNKRASAYKYDAINRITDSYYRTSLGYGLVEEAGKYDLSGVSYDKNGNINALKRTGHTNLPATIFGTMDDLVYTYTGNQLQKVDDNSNVRYGFEDGLNTGNDYVYDANGNMTEDNNKDIAKISYNHLNLPTDITFLNGNRITYLYDATGVKLKKEVNDLANSSLTSTTYAGNFIYENNVLKFFSHPEGYTEQVGKASFNYIYQYKDHLGNIRLAYSDADADGSVATSEIIEENNYYPFGLKHKGYNNVINGTDHKYGYNGKEEQDELALNWIDYGARNYDASLGRWMNLDPLAENYRSNSPYNYVANTPLIAYDPDGKRISVVGTRNYRRKVLSNLLVLAFHSDAALKEINTAIQSDQTLYIAKGSGAYGKPNEYNGVITGYNPWKTTDSGAKDGSYGKSIKQGPLTTIIHEIAHFNKPNKGVVMVDNIDQNWMDGEVSAVEVENRVRDDLNLPVRTHYGGIFVFGKEAVKVETYKGERYVLRDKKNYGKYAKSLATISRVFGNIKYNRGFQKIISGNSGRVRNGTDHREILIDKPKVDK